MSKSEKERFFMLLSAIRDEFVFHCQCRKLSPRTIRNYEKQIDYLLRFLQQEHDISSIEDVLPCHIKRFLHSMLKAGRTTNYVNDLLKAFKVFFRYAFEEGYTDTLLTQRIRSVKGLRPLSALSLRKNSSK